MTEARSRRGPTFHDQYWKNVSDEGTSWITDKPVLSVQIYLSDFEPKHRTPKSFIRALLNPDPARRATAEQALAHTYVAHELRGANRTRHIWLAREFLPTRTQAAQRDQHGASPVALRAL